MNSLSTRAHRTFSTVHPPLVGRKVCAHRGAYRTEFQYGTPPARNRVRHMRAYRTELQYGTLLRARHVSKRGAYPTEVQYGTLFGAHDVGAYFTE